MHLRESRISKFPGGPCPQTPLGGNARRALQLLLNSMQLLLSKVVKALHTRAEGSVQSARSITNWQANNSKIWSRCYDILLPPRRSKRHRSSSACVDLRKETLCQRIVCLDIATLNFRTRDRLHRGSLFMKKIIPGTVRNPGDRCPDQVKQIPFQTCDSSIPSKMLKIGTHIRNWTLNS